MRDVYKRGTDREMFEANRIIHKRLNKEMKDANMRRAAERRTKQVEVVK